MDKGGVTDVEVSCTSTCTVATSDEGTKTLEYSSDSSRGHVYGTDSIPAECERKVTCGTFAYNVKRTARSRWQRI